MNAVVVECVNVHANAQMQMQMMCTGKEKAYFFNYLIFEGVEYHHEIIVERDDLMIALIISRLAEVIEIKNEFINKIKTNKQKMATIF